MKKKLLTLLAIFALSFLLISCSSDDDKDDDPPAEIEKILDSGTDEDGVTWKVKMSESFSEEEGKLVGISYSRTSVDEQSKIGFGILKQELNNTITYKVLYVLESKKVKLDDYWDSCVLSANSQIPILGVIDWALEEDDGSSSYNILGTLAESDINKLKQATIITFETKSSLDEELNVIMVMPITFQSAMMKYF